MNETKQHKRILIYSHDSFGLGHLRRCRAIAHSLVDLDDALSVLILSGSPIVGSFDFRARVDFVRIPGVIKLRNGDYTSLKLHIDIEDTLKLRSSIIRHTADTFEPDLFIVDKEPLGLRGEVRETLELLKQKNVPTVLGLRDVMDAPVHLAPEWERKKVLPALEDLYSDIWVYGMPQIHDPLEGINLPETVRNKMNFTGYLKREIPTDVPPPVNLPTEPYILVTPGGGGDGVDMVDWVLRAYEEHPNIPYNSYIVLGPFMQRELRQEFKERVAKLDKVSVTTFDARPEFLIDNALGMVAMGGYNTFCEILSFDKKAIIVPREVPRLEQTIRAQCAQDIGLVRMLADDGVRDSAAMAEALTQLPHQQRPSQQAMAGLLDGLPNLNRLAHKLLHKNKTPQPDLVVASE